MHQCSFSLVFDLSRSHQCTMHGLDHGVFIVAPGNNVITDWLTPANGMYSFRFYGEPVTDYVVLGSTNLVNWVGLATNQISGLGYLEFTDTSATNFNHRFYRVAPSSAPGE